MLLFCVGVCCCLVGFTVLSLVVGGLLIFRCFGVWLSVFVVYCFVCLDIV